jgi:hypothetical protein
MALQFPPVDRGMPAWHGISINLVMAGVRTQGCLITRREVVRALVLSPLYWRLGLRERALLVRSLAHVK